MTSYSNIPQPTIEKTNRPAKQKILASAMSLFLLGSTAIGAEKKTLDKIVEPAPKVEVAQPQSRNMSLGGVKVYYDTDGNIAGEFNFGTFYADKKTGFLGGLTVDFPHHKSVSSHIQDWQFRNYDWDRVGLMFSAAVLKGKPGKYLLGPEIGIGIQNTRLNSTDIIIGNGSIDEPLKDYVLEENEEKNSVFYKLGALFMVRVKGGLYLTINAGAKGGISHITPHGMDNRLEKGYKIAPYAGLGFVFKLPWKIGAPEQP
jgi:hypothetical protein